MQYFGEKRNIHKMKCVMCIGLACNWIHLTWPTGSNSFRYQSDSGTTDAAVTAQTSHFTNAQLGGHKQMPTRYGEKALRTSWASGLLSENFVCLDLLLGTPEATKCNISRKKGTYIKWSAIFRGKKVTYIKWSAKKNQKEWFGWFDTWGWLFIGSPIPSYSKK